MNILFLSPGFRPDVKPVATRTYEQAKYWVRAGHKVTILAGHPAFPFHKSEESPKGEYQFISREKIEGIHVYRIYTFQRKSNRTIAVLVQYMLYALIAIFQGLSLRKTDIIVATSPNVICSLSGLILGGLLGVPFVNEVRELWPDIVLVKHSKFAGVFSKLLYVIERYIYQKSDHIVVLSKRFIPHIKAITTTKITFIPEGVDKEFWNSPELLNNGNIQIQKGRLKIGYVGSFDGERTLDIVIDVAKKLENSYDIHFYFIGDGPEKDRLNQRIDEEKLHNVSIYGLQPRNSMPAIMEQLDVMLILLKDKKLYETLIPPKLFESMVMRKPVIVGMKGETKEIVEKSGAGFAITPESRNELLQHILKFYDNPNHGDEFGENGYQYVNEYHLRSDLAHKYLRIFTSLVNK